jgi:hypothetical protein
VCSSRSRRFHPEVVIHELIATGLSSHSVTRGIRRLLPPPGCPTGTVMPRGSWGAIGGGGAAA